ncbi:superoxide dismutase family protein [Paraurantiacibacter namhicola]|uniref:Superoxide dismutase-like protein YojM n=1 Tax=Paraurantiacibacter namhicola TaxID=645517 RepID=A0A1C7D552_9SPHN|nr:superoxide dismutase family protein [Paraurantiacibacter namhicola]ANU06606.1 Superoxide dismutase-like protein YojM precursor [Paraurantiacibacter namhicola]
MRSKILAALPALAFLAGCQTIADVPTERLGSATLRFANGLPAGTAQFYGNGSQVDVTVALGGFSAGEHAVHLHTTGSCVAPDFTSAGGHLNPRGNEHGTLNPQGAHLGDLPNVTIGPEGAGTVSATLTMPRDEALEAIYDADGTAIVVHAGPDDYKSDPAGAAGSRVACGVFTR